MIEDGLLDPIQAHCSKEEQRRRILLELESPIVHAPSAKHEIPDGMDPKLYAVEKRAEMMRRRNFYEKNPERKATVNDRIGTMLRDARAAAKEADLTV